MSETLTYKLQSYYNNRVLRGLVNTVYIINQIALTIYLLFIPIQIAYFWLLIHIDDGHVQTIIDACVLVFFIVHVGLFFDEKLYQWMKSPYTSLRSKLITFQLIFDILCVILAIYALILVNKSIKEQIVELIFVGKVYKLIKFDLKCMYIVIGTPYYPFYKVLRTLLILLMVISYVGSLFYGIAYYLYTLNIQYEFLLWIYDSGAVTDLVSYPFINQLEYAMYWALGTASTAAYGDISASEPTLVLINILALAFEGFLFGFYLNSMHSIPMESKEKEANLLQKFDAFQQHASNRKISKKLYLQILCSLEYTESQKRKMHEIQKYLPKKYLRQIKYSMYSQLLNNPIFFSNSEFQLELADKIEETVSEMGEDVYDYKCVKRDDLLYIKEGLIQCYLDGELQEITMEEKGKGDYFGVYEFITGLLIPQKAVCANYCFLYKIGRENYKKILPDSIKLQFNALQIMAFRFEGAHLSREPMVKFIRNICQSDSKFLFLFNYASKQTTVIQKYKQVQEKRTKFERFKTKSKRLVEGRKTKTRSVETQTQNPQQKQFENVYIWDQSQW